MRTDQVTQIRRTSLGLFSQSLVQVQLDRENCRSLNAFLLLTPTIALLAFSLRQFQPPRLEILWIQHTPINTFPPVHFKFSPENAMVCDLG
jgi:hypothetical protein